MRMPYPGANGFGSFCRNKRTSFLLHEHVGTLESQRFVDL